MKESVHIKDEIRMRLEYGIEQVLSGRFKKYEAFLISPQMIKGSMNKPGWECSEIETNGWQYDWWLTFTKGDKSFTAFGSGYYGTFEFAKTAE
jgi:hypothetical protein